MCERACSKHTPVGDPSLNNPLHLACCCCLSPLPANTRQAVTNFATTTNGVLASTFLLYSVGLGAGAIPTAGALNWVLKDGLGQMGTLLFGKAIAHNFDIHSKTWYFMSFLLLSTATGVLCVACWEESLAAAWHASCISCVTVCATL